MHERREEEEEEFHRRQQVLSQRDNTVIRKCHLLKTL